MELVEKEEPKEFRYGVPEDIYSDWREMQRRIGLPQTQILHRLVRFLLSQDQITQMMILDQIDAKPDLIEFALARASSANRSRRQVPGGGTAQPQRKAAMKIKPGEE